METIRARSDILNVIIHGYGLDHEWVVFRDIIETCGLIFDDYIDDESLLTKELLERHYNDILKDLPKEIANFTYLNVLYIIVLGALILLIGARLPDDLREKIVSFNIWEFELKKRWRAVDDDFLKKRKKILIDLQNKIRDHVSGESIEVDILVLQGNEYDGETEKKIVEVCGLNWDDYLRAHSLTPRELVLTREVLEENLDRILIAIENLTKYNINNYLILAALILKTGSQISESLKEKLFKKADWKEELKIKWILADDELLKERKNLLSAFQRLVQMYS